MVVRLTHYSTFNPIDRIFLNKKDAEKFVVSMRKSNWELKEFFQVKTQF